MFWATNRKGERGHGAWPLSSAPVAVAPTPSLVSVSVSSTFAVSRLVKAWLLPCQPINNSRARDTQFHEVPISYSCLPRLLVLLRQLRAPCVYAPSSSRSTYVLMLTLFTALPSSELHPNTPRAPLLLYRFFVACKTNNSTFTRC